MSEPTALLSVLDKTSAPLVAGFAFTCGVAVLAYYTGVPGFALLDPSAVGAITFAGFLALVVLSVKWRRSHTPTPRVKRRFNKLSETQRVFLMDVRASGKSWFKAYAEDEPWFKELAALAYVEIAHPILIIDGGPLTYQLTAQGKSELDRVASPNKAGWLTRLRGMANAKAPRQA